MKSVYIVKHDVCGYEDGSFESFVEVFDDRESAVNYFNIKKEQIIKEYLDYAGEESLEVMKDEHGFYYTIKSDYSYFDLDDYGADKLKIEEKDIMHFELI